MKPKPHINSKNRHALSIAIDEALEENQKAFEVRGYLGMSSIGKVCARSLWYTFHFASPPVSNHSARTLRNFADGHRTEELIADRIKLIPSIELLTETDDQQYGISAVGGHYRGHVDGFLKGVPDEDPGQVFLWENKCSGMSVYNKMKKLINECEGGDTSKVLYQWNMVYYIQAIVYMHYFNMNGMSIKECIHTVDAAGGREETLVIKTKEDSVMAEAMEAKAKQIIFTKDPTSFSRIASDPSAYDCTFCDHKRVCFHADTMQENCRTCVFSEPTMNGDAEWQCTKHNTVLTLEEQKAGCEDYQQVEHD